MNRRDFLRTGTLVLAGSGLLAADESKPLKIPFKGDMFQRDDGRLVLAGRGLVYSVSDDWGQRWSQTREVLDSSFPDKGRPIKKQLPCARFASLAVGPGGDLLWTLAAGQQRPPPGDLLPDVSGRRTQLVGRDLRDAAAWRRPLRFPWQLDAAFERPADPAGVHELFAQLCRAAKGNRAYLAAGVLRYAHALFRR